MNDFEQIYKQLTSGLKRSLKCQSEENEGDTTALRVRVLPKFTEPVVKKSRPEDQSDEKRKDKGIHVEILVGTQLAYTGVNRRAQAAKKKQTPEKLSRLHAEKMQHIRKLNRIYTWGDDIPDPLLEFADLDASSSVLIENVGMAKIVEPSPIQMQSIPVMLAKRNLLASAPTGSGKTLAFSLPIIDASWRLHKKVVASGKTLDWTVAIVLEPTRVLAKQAHQQIELFAKGLPLKCTFLENDFDTSSHIVVTTPNKLIFAFDALDDEQKSRALKRLRWLIVDESDRIFDKTEGDASFRPQLEKIIAFCDGPKTRHAFFSATFSYVVEEWCAANLERPVMVCIGARNSANASVEQRLVFAGWEQGKVSALKTLIKLEFEPPALVFVQSKERAKMLFVELKQHFKKLQMALISGDVEHKKCDELIASFRADNIQLLICTELIGRGLDFANVNLVVNFDLPTSVISYIHRIGRTGRAGRKGKAITYFTQSDMDFIRPIATVIHQAGFPVADYLLKLRKVTKNDREKLRKRAPQRQRIVREFKWKRFVPRYAKKNGVSLIKKHREKQKARKVTEPSDAANES